MILTRDGIAWRIARDLHEGAYVNLGVGIPVLVSNYLDRTQEIFLHSENGILGVGPVPKGDDIDLDLISAGKGFCTLALGAAIFDQQISFAMMRGGHLTHAVLGAIEVAQNGDFANWKVPGEAVPGVGGAMDLAVGAPNILIAMSHVTNKGIYTDIAIVDVTADGLVLREAMPGFDPAAVQAKTEAVLIVAPDFREMEVPETAANGAKLQQ